MKSASPKAPRWLALFLICHNIHSNPQASFFDLGRCRVQDRRMQSVMKFNVDTCMRFGNRTALEVLRADRGIRSLRPGETTLRVCFKFLSTGLGYISERATFGPGEPQIENGLRSFIEGFNGHRTSHKSLSDSVRQYHFAADRAPPRCALLHFKARSSLVDSEEPRHPEAIRRWSRSGSANKLKSLSFEKARARKPAPLPIRRMP